MSAQRALASLKVKGRASKTGYARAEYGRAWADVDQNGCDTRNDILRRDLSAITAATDRCIVLTGVLADPYQRATVTFQRGPGTSADVQIDHVVALADAWVKGAQGLTKTARTRFANDPLNLLATTSAMNAKKKSADAATWLPPRKDVRCDYVARQIAVKRIYQLWVTRAEHKAMAAILARCPGEPLPTARQAAPPDLAQPMPIPTTSTPGPTDPTTAPTSPTPSSTTTSPTGSPSTTSASPTTTVSTTTAAPTTTTTTAGTDPRFRTCADAKAAGYGPYTRGVDPEYNWYRDADGDGVVCE